MNKRYGVSVGFTDPDHPEHVELQHIFEMYVQTEDPTLLLDIIHKANLGNREINETILEWMKRKIKRDASKKKATAVDKQLGKHELRRRDQEAHWLFQAKAEEDPSKTKTQIYDEISAIYHEDKETHGRTVRFDRESVRKAIARHEKRIAGNIQDPE